MTSFAEEPSAVTPEGALVRAYLAGDTDAFTEIYDTYAPRLSRYLYGKLGDRTEAEELTQETMARALRGIATYDLVRPFWPWLKAIARNADKGEWPRRTKEVLTPEFRDEPVGLDDEADRIVTHAAVMQALALIPTRQSRALVMRYVEDRDGNDLAVLFGLSRNGFEQLLRRGRENMRKFYRAPVVVVPGLSRLVARMRRSAADAGSRLQAVGGAGTSFGGELMLGAALTVGGIGLAIGVHVTAEPNDRVNRAGSPTVAASVTSYAPVREGGVFVVRGSSGVGGGAGAARPATGEAVAGDGAAWDDAYAEDAGGSSAEAAKTAEAGATGETAPGAEGGVSDPDVVAPRGDGPQAPTPWPGGTAPEDPRVNIAPPGAPTPETDVHVDPDGRSTATVGGDDDVAEGELALNRQIAQEGEIAKEEVSTEVVGLPVGVKNETYTTEDNELLGLVCYETTACN